VAHLAGERLGAAPVLPSLHHKLWCERVAQRARSGRRMVLRLEVPHDVSQDSFTLVPVTVDLDDPTHVHHDGPDSLVACEWRAASRAWRRLGATAGPVELDVDDVLSLLGAPSARLGDAGIEMLVPPGLRTRASASTTLRVSGSSGHMNAESLKLTCDVTIDGERVGRDDLARIAAATHDFVSVNGRLVLLDATERRKLAARLRGDGVATPLEVLEAADEGVALDLSALGGNDWLRRHAGGEWTPTVAERVTQPEGFDGELYPHQLEGLSWITWLEDNHVGGILADDMGLGKTATVLARVLADHAGPTLVVVPSSLLHNWRREAARFAPSLRVLVHHGGARHSEQELRDADVVLTTYGTLPRDTVARELHWHRVVLDEAQRIKNPTTAAARAARSLHAEHRLAVTGTPMENSPVDLWSVMSFANPGLLGSLGGFTRRYCGPAADLSTLRSKVALFMLRRTKTDPALGLDLPGFTKVRHDCHLTSEQAALYRAAERQLLAGAGTSDRGDGREVRILSGIARLKQVCNHPAAVNAGSALVLGGRSGKLDRLLEVCRQIVDAGEAAVVFTQYPGFMSNVAGHLGAELGVEVLELNGTMSPAARAATLDEFADADGPPLLCASYGTGGAGLNLVRANHVVLFDLWWNPAVEDQATDRVFRLGQTREVVCHTLVCTGTLEERIVALLHDKRDKSGQVVCNTQQYVTSLDQQQLAEMVRLDD